MKTENLVAEIDLMLHRMSVVRETHANARSTWAKDFWWTTLNRLRTRYNLLVKELNQ